jgi:TolB-like protein
MSAQLKWPLGALVACVVVLAPGWASAEPRVAILPVVVHSGAADPRYLSEGFSDMLAARLEQLGGMRVVREVDVRAATTRLPEAIERGKALEADYVVFGSFTQFGDGASLDVQCAPVRAPDAKAARTLFVQSGAIGEIIPKLDDLADKIAYFVLGDAQGKSAIAGRSGGTSPIRDLLLRLEALEKAVYGKAPAAARAPEAVPAEEPAPGEAEPEQTAPGAASTAEEAAEAAANP